MLSKHILTAKGMIIKNLKIQMLAGNSLKMCVSVGFEISSTLAMCGHVQKRGLNLDD